MAADDPAHNSDFDDPELLDLLVAEFAAEQQRLPEALSSGSGRERLLADVVRFPTRYAPFIPKLAALWDLAEGDVERWFASAPRPEAWKWTWPGVRSVRAPSGPSLAAAEVRLVRFAPGLRFPAHRHEGDERVLVLEGSYTDSTGVCVGPGELQRMHSGSEHSLLVARQGPCIATTVRGALQFSGPLLGRLSRWFGG